MKDIEWHHLKADQIITRLQSNIQSGLSLDAVQQLRDQYGSNVLTTTGGTSNLVRFLLQFHQPLIYILIGSGCITALLQEWVDSGVIFGVVLVNGIIGYIQEARAENALAALADTMVAEALVIRDNTRERIPSTELVPGDIVLLSAGDRVPADLRILLCRDLQIDESALTGESLPVEKYVHRLERDTELAERNNMAYTSTLVTYGQATAIVTETGDRTEVGRISGLISSAHDLATPLTRKITRFSQILLYAILLLTLLTVAVGLLRGQPLFDMFMAAVALAVGAIPEGLPAAVTITLAIGVSRMAKRRAIIRKLPAVETLGSTTVICSDKTGTLTENQMTVQLIAAGEQLYEVSGSGYAPNGAVKDLAGDGLSTVTENKALNECLQAGVLCNDSLLKESEQGWQVQGDPTEGALITAAAKAGIIKDALEQSFPRLDSIPFESGHQYMATLHNSGVGKPRMVYMKGAVEQVLAKCDFVMGADGSRQLLSADGILGQVSDMADRGLRVLALACKELPDEAVAIAHQDVDSGLTFLGVQAMLDPPRKEAVAAVKICQTAGIEIKMITGDHPATAAAIAEKIGIVPERTETETTIVLTGRELEQLSDEELIPVADKTVVFARATPEQKIRLVKALQATGNVVAMTGDGVNDAPALKQADIGVAMGITGTDVSREAADMVLTDDNFSSIEAAVEEGRGVFDNLTKFIVWTLPTNLGEGLVIMAAVFAGATLPILPVQILWINMTTAGFLGLTLAFEPREAGIMERMPRDPKTPILTNELIIRIFLVGSLLLIGSFGLFQWELAAGASIEEARTVAVNVFIVMELFYLFNCRSLSKSIFKCGLFTNKWVFAGVTAMMLLQMVYTYLPLMQHWFNSASIGLDAWARIMVIGLAACLIVEGEKMIRRRGNR